MHTVICVEENGDVSQIAHLGSEAQVKGKLDAMSRAGQEGIALYFQNISIDQKLLVWDREQKRLTKRRETLAELRGPMIEKLRQHHGQAVTADIDVAGETLQGDGRAQVMIVAMATRIRTGASNPHGGQWRTKANKMIDFSDADVLALDAALMVRNTDCQRKAWALADKLRGETDAAKLKGFDLTAEWDKLA